MTKIKNALSLYLPSPAKTFHSKMQIMFDMLCECKSEIHRLNCRLDDVLLEKSRSCVSTQIPTQTQDVLLARNEKILKLCNLKGKGLEISPSFNPVLPKSQGYDVETLDHLDKAGLIQKYTGHNVNLKNIEEPNYIWAGGSYIDAIGKRSYYDYIIASHIIEHTVDIIGFLNDCMELLRPEGVLSLAIPDKRKCFDHFRPLSSVAEAVNAFYSDGKRHSIGAVCEHFLNAVSLNGNISWSEINELHKVGFVHPHEDVKGIVSQYPHDDCYVDIHNWVFTKPSFELLFYDLVVLDFLKGMDIAKAFETNGIEFFITIRKTNNDAITHDYSTKRLNLLRLIDKE